MSVQFAFLTIAAGEIVQEEKTDFNPSNRIGHIISGILVVVVTSWVVYYATEIMERILYSFAVTESENAVVYDSPVYLIWKIMHFLNGPVLSPLINLALILTAGIYIIRSFDTKEKRLYFGIPFGLAYILNILIGISAKLS